MFVFLGSKLSYQFPSDSQSPTKPLLIANGWQLHTHNGFTPSSYSPSTVHNKEKAIKGGFDGLNTLTTMRQALPTHIACKNV